MGVLRVVLLQHWWVSTWTLAPPNFVCYNDVVMRWSFVKTTFFWSYHLVIANGCLIPLVLYLCPCPGGEWLRESYVIITLYGINLYYIELKNWKEKFCHQNLIFICIFCQAAVSDGEWLLHLCQGDVSQPQDAQTQPHAVVQDTAPYGQATAVCGWLLWGLKYQFKSFFNKLYIDIIILLTKYSVMHLGYVSFNII